MRRNMKISAGTFGVALLSGATVVQAVEITVEPGQVVSSHTHHPFGINLNYLRDVDPLAVVEWSFKYNKQRNDLVSVLGVSDVAGWQYSKAENMLNHMYWTTQFMDQEKAGSVFCTLDVRNELTATGRAAWIIGNFFTRYSVECNSSEPQRVHAYAFLDKAMRAVNLLLINRTDTSHPVKVEFRKAWEFTAKNSWIFAETGPLDTAPGWQEQSVIMKELPAYSAALIQYAEKGIK